MTVDPVILHTSKFTVAKIPVIGMMVTKATQINRVNLNMVKRRDTGRDPSLKALREADRVTQLHPDQQRSHPSAIAAEPDKLRHINTYGALPDFYIDRPFICRHCGKREIWRAVDQKWYYEEAKGHIDATAVECHTCRSAKKRRNSQSSTCN